MATPLSGWQPLIVCENNSVPAFNHPCGFTDLVVLAQNFITDLILLSTIFAVVAFIFAAFKLITSGGKVGAKEDAKRLFLSVLLGYVWIVVAWLLVYTITSVLLKEEFNFILGKP